MEGLDELIGYVKEVQVSRKLDRNSFKTVEKLSSNNDNNLDNISESSDDNCVEKVNMSASDKGEKYDHNKISNLNIRQGKIAGKNGCSGVPQNRGAIPKKSFPQNTQNWSQKNFQGSRKRRDNSSESENCLVNMQRKSYARGFPKNEYWENRETASNTKIFNRQSCSDFRQRFPFYYKVPNNPDISNPLPPGIYLVIPQTSINFLPLEIFSHPQAECSEKKNGKEDYEKKSSNKNNEKEDREKRKLNKNNEKKGWNKDSFDRGEFKNFMSKNQEKEFSDTSACEEDNNENNEKPLVLGTFHGVIPSTNEILGKFVKYLPFYDANKLMQEFHKRGLSVGKFINEMLQRKRNEIQDKIFEAFPDIDLECLEEYITDALKNFKNVDDFIEDKKRKRGEQVLASLNVENLKNDFELLQDICDQYEGNGDVKNTLMKKIEEAKSDEKVVETLTQIYNILPDVDLKFILKLLTQVKGNSEKLNDAILQLLESEDYPKMEESDAKYRDKMNLWRYYVTSFSVKSFLEKVPNPEEYFSSFKERVYGNGHEKAAIKFLKMRYPVLEEDQIKLTLSSFNGSISNTCLQLDKLGYFCNVIGENILEEDFDELFLQEVCYCTNRKKILEFIRVEKERRELEVEECKYEKGFLECLNCFDDEVLPSDIAACPDGHLCCKNCFIRYIEISYGSGKLEFICLSGSCDSEYGFEVLKKFIGQNLLLNITKKKAMEEVEKAGVSGLEKCPYCHYAYIPDPEDKVFRCENLDCLTITCRFCKEPSHLPLSCSEVERPREVAARKRVEEAMSKKLVRYCPGCNKGFVKIDGCNKISCSCGTISCYVCLSVVSNYNHFSSFGNNTGKCPLYSNNYVLHVEEVEKAGNKEKRVILEEDKNVKFLNDPTKNFRSSAPP